MAEPTESESSFVVNFSDGQSYEVTRDSATLYTFFGALSVYNHVFLEFPLDDFDEADVLPVDHVPEGAEVDNSLVGCYIFGHETQYETLAAFLSEHDFPMFLNLRQVTESDKEAYIQQQMRQIDGLLGPQQDTE